MDRGVYHRLNELEGEHWWFCARRKILREVIARVVRGKSNLRILEVGCGTGGNLMMLAEFGRLAAFEFDQEARGLANAKRVIDVVDGELPHRIPFPPGTFDIVVAFDVIEHVERDVESLRSLGNLLTLDGRLIVTVPAFPWLWSGHDESHRHFRRYTRKNLIMALEQAGLARVRVSYFNTLLFPAVATVRLLKKVSGSEGAIDDFMPAPLLNKLLKWIFGLESRLVLRLPMPFGVSLLAVTRRAR